MFVVVVSVRGVPAGAVDVIHVIVVGDGVVSTTWTVGVFCGGVMRRARGWGAHMRRRSQAAASAARALAKLAMLWA